MGKKNKTERKSVFAEETVNEGQKIWNVGQRKTRVGQWEPLLQIQLRRFQAQPDPAAPGAECPAQPDTVTGWGQGCCCCCYMMPKRVYYQDSHVLLFAALGLQAVPEAQSSFPTASYLQSARVVLGVAALKRLFLEPFFCQMPPSPGVARGPGGTPAVPGGLRGGGRPGSRDPLRSPAAPPSAARPGPGPVCIDSFCNK